MQNPSYTTLTDVAGDMFWRRRKFRDLQGRGLVARCPSPGIRISEDRLNEILGKKLAALNRKIRTDWTFLYLR